jgi:hypothetical protein
MNPGRSATTGPVVAMIVAVACLFGAASTDASPAHFTYELCDPAFLGGNPPAIEFHAAPGAAYGPFQTCASAGGALGVTETGQVTQTAGRLEVAIPATPGGFVEGETIDAFASNLQPGNEHSHVYVAEDWPLNYQSLARYFQIRSEPSALFGVGNGGGFDVTLDCSASPCNPGGVIGARDVAVREVDPVAPVIGKVEGPLLSGTVLRGHQALIAEATDTGGGLSAIEVRVNGLQAPGAVPGACSIARVANASYEGVAATSPTPCPPTLLGSWSLDTATAPFQEGQNTVQVCASDLATEGEPNTTCSPPQVIEVNNSCTESPVAGGQVLSANLLGAGEAVTVGYGEGAQVTGSLADQAGDPISGATICVEAQSAGSEAPPAPIATATTGANGEFTYDVSPGPNRRLLVGYRHDSFQVAKTLSVNSHTRPSMVLSAGRIRAGESVGIGGELPGPDAAGRVLVLQASALHGKRWLTFRRVTTGPKGGFHADYHFARSRRTTTYRLRAAVPRQAGYDYEPGVSEAARVKVKGVRKHHRHEHEHHPRRRGGRHAKHQ